MKISPIYPGVEDENILIHELPTELNTSTHSSLLLEVQRDKLTVKYIGKANHNHDVGGIQANRCCPPSLPLYYFELTVLDAGTRGCIAIGLADGNFQLTRQPGWDRNSFGYHGEDGRKYHDSSRGHESFRGGEAYGPVFTTGDTVGCGVLYASGDIFFTKNGNHLGTAFKRAALNVTLFPTIGLHSPSEMVQVNFGQVPFKFDLDVLFAGAWLHLEPHTGRTHQLRVHCADLLKAPILGDFKYGIGCPVSLENIFFDAKRPVRLHLHARMIVLPDISHPSRIIQLEAPLPDHMKLIWDHFSFDAKRTTPILRRLKE